MKNTNLGILVVLIVALSLTACAIPTQRVVTHTAATAPSALYLTYAEVTGTNFFITSTTDTTSRIMRCVMQDDNSVVCDEQTNAIRALNPQLKD